ncbi:MAG: MFS transporter [Myxococcales bacterium]|nr:MFS transporter [Myxococcales bacterium]
MNLLNYVDRFVLPAIIEKVRVDIPMNDKEQGVALTAFIWVYMVTAPLFGRLGDRGPRKGLLALGVALWSLATAAAAMAQSFTMLVLSRAVVGIGEAAYATLSPALLGDLFGPKDRGRAMAFFYLATPVGSALGYVIGGQVESHFGWRAAFLAVGLPGLVIAASALLMKEPPRGQFDEAKPELLPLGETLRALAANRIYRWSVLGSTFYTFALGGLAQWMPTYLTRVRHLDGARANTLFGALTVVTGILGTVLGGWAAERLKPRTRHAYLAVSAVATLAAVPFSVAAFAVEDAALLWPVIFVAELFVFVSTGPMNAVLADALPPSMRAMGFAVSLLAMHALGDAVSPALIGAVSDATGSLSVAVMLVPLFFSLAAAVWALAWRRLPAAGTEV